MKSLASLLQGNSISDTIGQMETTIKAHPTDAEFPLLNVRQLSFDRDSR